MKIEKKDVHQRFLNKSDCYADIDNGLPIMAMTFDAVWELINALPASEDEWVSVDDRLPEPRETVLVFTKYKSRLTGQIQLNEEWHIGVGDRRASDYVTHWQPLPQPPNP